MIADLINDKLNIRLITKNVMSVYSTNSEYTDFIIRKLKHSSYTVNNDKALGSDKFISYIKKTYNIYENIFKYVSRNAEISTSRFIEYLNFLDLNHLLWLHFYQLSEQNRSVVEILMQLSTHKKVIIIDYIDHLKCKDKLYSLLFKIGLEDKLVIVPFINISDAINNSTCQCYVKSPTEIKIQSRFSEKYINYEFHREVANYVSDRPKVYIKDPNVIVPVSYRYSLYELITIFLFNVKMLLINLYNWRFRVE